MKLLLFDIDGTLISAGGAGSRSLTKAFEKLLGIKDAFNNFEMAGKTDIQIIKEGLLKWNIEAKSDLIYAIIEEYLSLLKIEIQNNSKHIKPGVLDFIHFNISQLGYPMGLLTGNLEKGARIKLEPFNLNPLFPIGAYGSDHENRNYLLPIAVERFQKTYRRKINFHQCIIIGDTPRDVECAKIYGAKAVAVATGPYSETELLKTKADVVVKDLSHIDWILPILS